MPVTTFFFKKKKSISPLRNYSSHAQYDLIPAFVQYACFWTAGDSLSFMSIFFYCSLHYSLILKVCSIQYGVCYPPGKLANDLQKYNLPPICQIISLFTTESYCLIIGRLMVNATHSGISLLFLIVNLNWHTSLLAVCWLIALMI